MAIGSYVCAIVRSHFGSSIQATSISANRGRYPISHESVLSSGMAPWFLKPLYKSVDRKPDGVFILDSFGMTGLDRIRMRTYIPSALEYVYLRTGNLCVAAQCGEGYEDDGYTELFDGATLMAMMMVMYDGDCSNSAYEHMFCVIISMGKDVYKMAVRQIDPVSIPDRSQIGPRSTAVRAQIGAHVNLINLVY